MRHTTTTRPDYHALPIILRYHTLYRTMADQYFGHLSDHGVAVCRTCRHAVYPDQALSHLRAKHARIPPPERATIAAELQTWPALYASTDDLILPVAVDRPLLGLPVHRDGLQCQLRPGECFFIARKLHGMKKHWREKHNG